MGNKCDNGRVRSRLLAVCLAVALVGVSVVRCQQREARLRSEFESAQRTGGWQLVGGGMSVPLLQWSTDLKHPLPFPGLQGRGSGLGGVQFGLSSSLDRVALRVDQGPLRVIDVGNSSVVFSSQPPTYPTSTEFNCPFFEPDGRLVYVRQEWFGTRYGLGFLERVDLASAAHTTEEIPLPDDVCTILCPCPEMTRDGQFIAWVGYEDDESFKKKTVHLATRAAAGWEIVRSWPGGSFALDPNGIWIATTAHDGILLSSARDGSPISTLKRFMAREKPVAASPDGRWLLARSNDPFAHDLRFYRVEDGRDFGASLPEPKFYGSGTGTESWVWAADPN